VKNFKHFWAKYVQNFEICWTFNLLSLLNIVTFVSSNRTTTSKTETYTNSLLYLVGNILQTVAYLEKLNRKGGFRNLVRGGGVYNREQWQAAPRTHAEWNGLWSEVGENIKYQKKISCRVPTGTWQANFKKIHFSWYGNTVFFTFDQYIYI